MIERLVQSLRFLATSQAVEPGRSPDAAERFRAVALDYADALRLLIDCPQIQLEPGQRSMLEQLGDLLDESSSPEGRDEPGLGEGSSPYGRSLRVRSAALVALAALGEEAAEGREELPG